MSTTALAPAELATFFAFSFPRTDCLYAHGWRQALGWYFVFALCILRIIGNALQLNAQNHNSTDATATLLSSIVLSPLLLGAVSILQEARSARNSHLEPKIEWALQLAFHVLVVASLAMIAGGASALTGTSTSYSDLTVKMGEAADVAGYDGGTTLLTAVTVALMLLFLRIIYSLVSIFSPSSTFATSFAVRVCLQVVPEMLVVVVFVGAGIWTRNILRDKTVRHFGSEERVAMNRFNQV
ncbi:hypothetical protein MMC13_000142 [Lambiella insularis]|nr:hypothetical protein [Lambiella insularis]